MNNFFLCCLLLPPAALCLLQIFPSVHFSALLPQRGDGPLFDIQLGGGGEAAAGPAPSTSAELMTEADSDPGFQSKSSQPPRAREGKREAQRQWGTFRSRDLGSFLCSRDAVSDFAAQFMENGQLNFGVWFTGEIFAPGWGQFKKKKAWWVVFDSEMLYSFVS